MNGPNLRKLADCYTFIYFLHFKLHTRDIVSTASSATASSGDHRCHSSSRSAYDARIASPFRCPGSSHSSVHSSMISATENGTISSSFLVTW
jgi:hypothetical protein